MSLEDRIIAFLDGGLSPTERAALLREVHRDPRAKELLESHRMLRSLAKKSVRSVHAPAEFASQLAAIAATTPLVSAVPTPNRRRRFAPLALLLLGAVGISTVLYMRTTGTADQPTALPETAIASVASPTAEVTFEAREGDGVSASSAYRTHTSYTTHLRFVKQPSFDRLDANAGSTPTEILAALASPQQPQQSENLKPAAVREIAYDLSGGTSSARTLSDLRHTETTRTDTRFEASLQTSSGFTSPADAQPIKPFAQQRLGFGYYLTSSDVVGVRVTSGLYQVPGDALTTNESGVTFIQQNLVTRRSWGGELYVSHRFGELFNTPVVAVLTAAGGLIPNGYTVGAEAGLRLPTSDKFSFAVDFSLSRVHSNLDGTTILTNATSSQAPVMFAGTNVRNTLNGSLHYGIQYNF